MGGSCTWWPRSSTSNRNYKAGGVHRPERICFYGRGRPADSAQPVVPDGSVMTTPEPISQSDGPMCSEITSLYDKIGDITASLLGGNIHLGYWEDENDRSSVQEATDRVTRMVIDQLGVSSGHRVLDVGCGNGRP